MGTERRWGLGGTSSFLYFSSSGGLKLPTSKRIKYRNADRYLPTRLKFYSIGSQLPEETIQLWTTDMVESREMTSRKRKSSKPYSGPVKWKINVFHWFLFASAIDISIHNWSGIRRWALVWRAYFPSDMEFTFDTTESAELESALQSITMWNNVSSIWPWFFLANDSYLMALEKWDIMQIP